MITPVISKQTYDLAYECCLFLWHGVNFKSGLSQTSDAFFLNYFARQFIRHKQVGSLISYNSKTCTHFAKVAGLGRFIRAKNTDYTTAKSELNARILPLVINRRLKKQRVPKYQYGIAYNEILGYALGKPKTRTRHGVTTKTNNNKTTLASRLLFFILPEECCFNLNEKIAKALQIPKRYAIDFNADYCGIFADVLLRDTKILSQYPFPHRTNEIPESVWECVSQTDWWQRRILDVAMLLHFNLVNPQYTKDYLANKQTTPSQNPHTLV